MSEHGSVGPAQVSVRAAALDIPGRIHLRSLTGLRFFAAFAVVVYHLTQKFGSLNGLLHVTNFGFAGVSFFFILSGFVLTWSHRERTSCREFYWRRFSRVWPLHAITTLLAVGVAAILSLPLDWRTVLSHVTLTQAWFGDRSIHYGLNGLSWSLSAEAFFYLLFPVIFAGLWLKKNLWQWAGVAYVLMALVAAVVIILTSRSLNSFLLYVFPAYRIGEFIIGMCLALAIKRGWRPLFTTAQALTATALCYAALVAGTVLVFDAPDQLPLFIGNLWLVPGFVAIIAAAAAGDLRGDQGFLRSAPVVRLGQWSFALYLVHELMIRLAAPSFGNSGAVPALIAAVIVAIIAVGLSGLLYEWVEKPAEKRLRSLFAPRSAPRS